MTVELIVIGTDGETAARFIVDARTRQWQTVTGSELIARTVTEFASELASDRIQIDLLPPRGRSPASFATDEQAAQTLRAAAHLLGMSASIVKPPDRTPSDALN